MKKFLPEISVTWNSILVFAVLLSAFVIPAFPPDWGRMPVRLGFTLLFISGVLSLKKRNLMGITYSIVITSMIQRDPGAFNIALLVGKFA